MLLASVLLVCVCFFHHASRHLLGAHQALQVSGVDHATVDLELGEGIVDLGGGELVAEGHEGVSEGLGINLAVDLESLEGLEDGLVVVGAAGHLVGEQGHHLGEVHWAGSLIEHALGLTAGDGLAVVGEGLHEVISGQQTVLVDVHDAKGLLELLDGRVGEGVENVGLLGHGDVLCLEAGGKRQKQLL
jgi:hypothetical protein